MQLGVIGRGQGSAIFVALSHSATLPTRNFNRLSHKGPEGDLGERIGRQEVQARLEP